MNYGMSRTTPPESELHPNHSQPSISRAQMPSRTMLIITHRLVGLEGVDDIVVLDAGRVRRRGEAFAQH